VHLLSRVELIPNVFTAATLLLGVLALINIINGNHMMGIGLIVLAALTDRFDGMLARRYNAETAFGKEFDSLADIVSFGVAPAMLMYCTISEELGLVALICCCLYTLCGGLRLARYNLTAPSEYFQGIPITVCGTILAIIVFLAPNQEIVILAVSFILALAMISKIKFRKI
jgi:CDP-diacylglycerol--serine O-phosphatidyltransferase